MGTAAYPNRKTFESSGKRYERIEQLGEGGMGVVWRGRDLNMGGEVAIKVMKDVSDPAALELFEREWNALAALSHPNIVDVRDVGVLLEDGEKKPFFVMPMLVGKTLGELIRESSERLSAGRVVEIVRQVCKGLQAAHERGLIHRDLKPSNIFVLNDDSARIIDFGVVYLAGAHSFAGQKGTLKYMSPEQLMGREISPASDIFALGVILYEALTGRNPFVRQTRDEITEAVLKSMPQPVSELNPAISHGVAQVVHKCLAKRAINRFASARELSEMLGKALRNEPVFDASKVRDRVERVKAAIVQDLTYASELLTALESEGHLAPEITSLRNQVEAAVRQKRIDQLLSIARASIERDDEVEFGLVKLRELLEVDPQNVDALALKATGEKKRSERQVGKWIEIGNMHLDTGEFSEARNAANEALSSQPGDSKALELLRRIHEVETVARRVREQKEQIYNKALRDFQSGDIEAARSRLDHLFSEVRLHPKGIAPERDAVYESFYEQVCSACDSLRSGLEEAQKLLEGENFPQARAICIEQLAKYSNNEDFHALKIQIEDSERQKVSADFAAATKSADVEPDLNRRANIWQEAVKAHPQEARFAEQWKFTCERRDLVNSIVEKARQLGETGQFVDELNQWEKLKKLHPGYPGLAFELEQCRRKRDIQARAEDKARVAEEIVGVMKSRDFERALQQVRAALVEYADDPELLGLERIARESWTRTLESNRLFEEGRRAASVGDPDRAIKLLKRALAQDHQNSAALQVLLRVLTDEAASWVDSDLAEAEQYYQQAAAIDANHQLVRSVCTEISEARRQRYVSECLTEARGLDAVGDAVAALERIREGRKKYPRDLRLQQFHDSLLKSNPQLRLKDQLNQQQDELNAACKRLEREPNLEHAEDVRRRALELTTLDSIDPKSLKQAAEAHETIRRTLRPDDLDQLLHQNSVFNEDNQGQKFGNGDNGKNNDEPVRRPVNEPVNRNPVISPRLGTGWWRRAQERWIRQCGELLRAARGLDSRVRMVVAVAALLLIAIAVAIRHFNQAPLQPLLHVADITVHLEATPSDSEFRVNGVAHGSDFTVPQGTTEIVEVSRPGYQSQTVKLGRKEGNTPVNLVPWPVRVSVTSAAKNGDLELDGNNAAPIIENSAGLDVPADGQWHTISVVSGTDRVTQIQFQAKPGERPILTTSISAQVLKNLIVVAEMGAAATIYAGPQVKETAFAGQSVELGASGLDVANISDRNNRLNFEYQGQSGTLTLTAPEQPTLIIRSLSAVAEIAISSNVASATLTANGIPLLRRADGWRVTRPGTYTFVLSASNYRTETWTTVLKPAQSLHENHLLEAVTTPPAASALVISDSTPGALVEIDGTLAGVVGADGSAKFPVALAAGVHHVRLIRAGFCDSRPVEDVIVAPPSDARIANVKLEPCAAITLAKTAKPFTVKIFRSDVSGGKWIELTPGQRVDVRAGNYNVAVESEYYKAYQTGVRLEAGHNTAFAPLETPLENCRLERPDDITVMSGWMKVKNPGYVWVHSGCVNVNVSFRKSGKYEWEMSSGNGQGQIEWTLENGKIRRTVTVSGHSFDGRNASVKHLIDPSAAVIVIRVRVEGRHLKVLTENNILLDEYVAQNPEFQDLGSASVGVRTAAEFKVGGANE